MYKLKIRLIDKFSTLKTPKDLSILLLLTYSHSVRASASHSFTIFGDI